MRIFTLISLLFIVVMAAKAQTVEAENGLLSGTQISTQRAGYSGTGFVTGFDANDDKVTLTVTSNGGLHNLYIRYASASGDKYNFVFANGQNLGSAEFKSSTTFTETKVGKIFLKKGDNTIAIVKEWGYFDVDNIRLEPAAPSDFNRVDLNLVTPSPSHKADSLYDFMARVYGKVILSGQYGGTTELNRIKNVSGKTPVIWGFDFMDYSPSRVAFGTSSTEAERIIEWSKGGGITTLAWHWNAPKDLINQEPDKLWWSGFYTRATTFDVSKAMNDQASEEYTLIIRDIDAIAVQLKKLKDANIPVLWRPLHEAEGKWFWWGAKGPEPCKWLWKVMFERLVIHHQLNNLIWVWTSSANASASEWYPGDQYVDMIGADIYLPAGNYSTNLMMFDNLVSIYSGKKIIAISENGAIPNPENLFLERTAWSWFATWSGGYINDGINNSTAHINAVFNHEYVITLDEINQIDAIIQSLDQRRQQLEEGNEEEEEQVVAIEKSADTNFMLPNPIANNRLVLKTKKSEAVVQALLYNNQGKVEFTRSNFFIDVNDPLEVDFQNKASGLYLLKVVTQKDTKVFRVIKR